MGNGERCIDVLHIYTQTQASFRSLGQAKRASKLSLSLWPPVPIVRSNCTVMGRERERDLFSSWLKVIDTAKGGRLMLDNDLARDNHNL
jgi:hypothetical protein